MYIRRAQTRNTSTGESYHTHRLVQSRRVGAQVKQETLLNLGRHFEVAQDQWPTLCARVEEVLSGKNSLFPVECSFPLEREAQRIVAQLLTRQRNSAPQVEVPADPEGNIQSIDVTTLELSRPRSVGVEHVGLWAMGQVGLLELLEKLGFNGPQRAAAAGLVVGRMATPGSERATHRWLQNRSGLGEFPLPQIRAWATSSFSSKRRTQ